MQYGLGVRRIISNSNRPVSEYVYFWLDDPRDAFFEDDEQNVELSLKDFNPHLDSLTSSFSFTWSMNVRNGSEELVGNNYTEGFCTLVSHH